MNFRHPLKSFSKKKPYIQQIDTCIFQARIKRDPCIFKQGLKETLKSAYTRIHCVCIRNLKTNIDYVNVSISGIWIISNKLKVVFFQCPILASHN